MMSVATVSPTRRPLVQKFQQAGQVEAVAMTDLYPKAAGYVKSIHCDIGDVVKADQVLLEIDVPELAQELAYKDASLQQARALHAQALAGVKEAEANLKANPTQVALAAAEARRAAADRAFRDQESARYSDLASRSATTAQLAEEKASQAREAAAAFEGAEAKQKAVSDQKIVLEAKLEAARGEVQANAAKIKLAEADLERTRVMFDYAKLKAPFDGVIIRRNMDEGAYVRTPGSDRATPLFTLARTDRVRVVLHVPEREVLAIQPGCRAAIELSALGKEVAEGRVARTSRALNDQKTMRVEIDVENPKGRLYPGMYGRVTVYLREVADALTVPAGAIDSLNGSPCVVVVEGGVAHRIPVETGIDDGKVVQILSGLKGHERIVTSNKGEITEGQPLATGTPGAPSVAQQADQARDGA